MSNTKTSAAQPAVKYSPQGCSKPVMTHLTADERRRLDWLAKKDMRSLSATARMLIVQGLAAAEAE